MYEINEEPLEKEENEIQMETQNLEAKTKMRKWKSCKDLHKCNYS